MDDATPHRRGAWGVAVAVALLLALGPAATWIGARWIAARIDADIAQVTQVDAPRVAARHRRESARAAWAEAVRRPTVGTTLEALARVLPADAMLLRAGRGSDGALEIVVATADPDSLRAALRQDPMLGRLRDTVQERVDGGMRITLREQAS